MVFFPHWYQAEIKQISDLFDSCEDHFLSFNSFYNQFNVKFNFFQYYSILSSIPQNWEESIARRFQKPSYASHLFTAICSLSCKTIYSTLLNLEDLPPPTSEKKLLASGVEKSDLTKSTSYHSKPREKLNWRCSNTKSFTEFYQRIACYTKFKKLPLPPVPFVLLSVRPCGICL